MHQLWCRIRKHAKRLRVSVDLRWLGRGGYEAFAADVGTKPSHAHELIRIDTDLGFSPQNCIWATRTEAARIRPRRNRENLPNGYSDTPTWGSWHAMRQRCENPKAPGYWNYGGRGITVCDRWRESYAAFLADMGERPRGMTIDRRDSNGNYEPSNCRWATAAMQSRNTRAVLFEPHEPAQVRWLASEGYTQAEIARFFGVDRAVIGHIVRGNTWREDNI
jgi:hypothetical protein